MFPIDEADSWRQVDGRNLERIDVSAALDRLALELGAGDAGHPRMVQDLQDVVN